MKRNNGREKSKVNIGRPNRLLHLKYLCLPHVNIHHLSTKGVENRLWPSKTYK